MTQHEIFAIRHTQRLTIKGLEIERHQEGSDGSGHYRASKMASQTDVAAASERLKDVGHLSLGITHAQEPVRDEFVGILFKLEVWMATPKPQMKLPLRRKYSVLSSLIVRG